MNRNHNKKWVQLETMLFETPEKQRGPQTAKASSKLGLPKNQIFKFIRTNHPEGTHPRSLNALQIPNTPEKDKSWSKFGFDSDSRGNIDSKNTADSKQNINSRTELESKIPGSFNSIDEDLPEPMSSDHKPKRESKFKRGNFLSPDVMSSKKIQTVVITSRNSKKKYSLHTEYSSSLNNLEKQYKPTDPICSIDEFHFQILFKKKCEDMDITGYAETEEKFISNIRKNSLGTKLCFPESGFGKTALAQLGSMVSGNPEISQLQLRKSYLAADGLMVPFAKNLMAMPNLIHLDLANNALESQEFVVLFAALKRIQTLVSIDISNYEPDKKNKLRAEGVEAFNGFVKNNVGLQYVTLSNLMLEDNNVKSILSALQETPNLLILDLTSNIFTGSCLTELTELAAKTSIIKINLANNKLKKEAAENLAKFIQAQRKDNKDGVKEAKDTREGLELVLENTNLGSEIDMILESLGRGSNIKKLNFSRNLLADIEITHFETALSENKKLMELDLSDCKLGDIQGRMLALGLKKNRHLKSLVLGNNNLGDEAGALIIYSLLNNHSLKSLDLAQNKLGPDTAKALQEPIKKNPNLTKYNLIYNNFDEADGYLLQEALFFNAKITQFNIAYTRVKFNTLEAIDGIVKDNNHKLQFAAVPSLKDEVGKKGKFVEEEKHHMGLVGEFEKKKEEINRDVKRFAETLTDLKGREKSPTSKKKERLVLKLSKDIKEEQPKLEEINAQIREFQTQAQLEKESYMRLIEAELQEVEKAEKRIKAKQEEIEKMKQKYEPDIKILKYELSKLADELRFNEMYNETVSDKIKKEKQIINIQNTIVNAKVSDVFLATSELAKAKKKEKEKESPEKPPNSGTKLGSDGKPEEEKQENDKLSAGMELIRKTRQSRADKMIEEMKKKQDAKTKKKLRRMASKSDNTKQEMMRVKINEKLSKIFKEDKSKMEPISEGEIKD